MSTRASGDPAHDALRVATFWQSRADGAARKILIGANLVFNEVGYHGASTRMIAQRAQMSPGAIYVHFSSKEELFFRIVMDGHSASREALVQALRLSTDPTERLRLFVATYASWHAEWSVIARPVHNDMHVLTDEHFGEVVEVRRATMALLDEILDAGVDSGRFSIADLPGTRRLLMSVCIDVSRWYVEGGERSPSAIGLQYSDLALKLVTA
ncbi:MAG: TetR/AcrR family transcriptional regulator [Aeromicrobium sp.]